MNTHNRTLYHQLSVEPTCLPLFILAPRSPPLIQCWSNDYHVIHSSTNQDDLYRLCAPSNRMAIAQSYTNFSMIDIWLRTREKSGFPFPLCATCQSFRLIAWNLEILVTTFLPTWDTTYHKCCQLLIYEVFTDLTCDLHFNLSHPSSISNDVV